MKFVIMPHSLSLCLTWYAWFGQASSRTLKAVYQSAVPSIHARAIRFLVIIIFVVGRDCNPLGAPLSPLLAALGILLHTLDDYAGWHRLATTRVRFLDARDKERPGHHLITGILGGDVEQLLGGVPNNVVLCPIVRRLPGVMHVTPGRLGPQSLRTKVVPLVLIVSTPARVPCTRFGHCTHVPMADIMAYPGFYTWDQLLR
jgi:hypothetical protein